MVFALFVINKHDETPQVPTVRRTLQGSHASSLQELHVDLSLGHRDSHQVVLAEERSVRTVLVEHAGLSVGHSEGSSLQQLSPGVGVDGSAGSEALLGGDLEHAGELGVDTDCYSLWGGSAGGRMTAWLGSYGPAAFGGDDLPRPGAVIMQYTGHSEYGE